MRTTEILTGGNDVIIQEKPLHVFTNELMNKYTHLYDVYRDEQVGDLHLPFIAVYKRRDERYMITKKIKVYGVENQQIVYGYSSTEPITEQFLKRFQETIMTSMNEYLPQNKDHMSTIFVGLIITDQQVDSKVLKEVVRFRKLKFLKYGLHGWAEIYIAIINPYEKLLKIHPKGKAFVSSLEKMLREE